MATKKEVADHLFLTERQVYNLSQKPGFPVPQRRGKYDIDKCREWYIHYLKGLKGVSGEQEVGDEDEFARRERELKFQKLELDLAERRERLKNQEFKRELSQKVYAPIDLIPDVVSTLAVSLAGHLEGVVPSLKLAFPDLPIDVLTRIDEYLITASNELADVQIDLTEYLESDSEGDQAGIDAAEA